MNLSPNVRWILTAVFAGLTAFGAILPTLSGVPTWVGVAVAVAGAVGASLGLVPPQAGQAQVGVVQPVVPPVIHKQIVPEPLDDP
jgi:hypothetical protein